MSAQLKAARWRLIARVVTNAAGSRTYEELVASLETTLQRELEARGVAYLESRDSRLELCATTGRGPWLDIRKQLHGSAGIRGRFDVGPECHVLWFGIASGREVQGYLCVVFDSDGRDCAGEMLSEFGEHLATVVDNVRQHVRGRARLNALAAMVLRQEDLTSLQRTVVDLIDIARAEDGDLSCQRVDTRVEDVVRRVVANAAMPAADAGVELRVDIADGIVASLDRELIRRAVEHMVLVSIANAPGGRVTLRAFRAGGELVIESSHNGASLPSDVNAAGFRPYGISMTFCAHAVAGHGGRLDARNGTERGAILAIRIPLAGFEQMTVRDPFARPATDPHTIRMDVLAVLDSDAHGVCSSRAGSGSP